MVNFDRGQVLQQCRYLAEHTTQEETRCEILTSLLWIFNTEGMKTVTDADLKALFISLTKILTVSSITIQILAIRCIHAIIPRLDSALFIVNSLCKLYDQVKPLQPMCLRLLSEVSVDANVTEATKMTRIAASDSRDSALVSAAGYAASVIRISIADQATPNCTVVKGPAGAFLASHVKVDKLNQVTNPYAQLILIRRLVENKDIDSQKKLKLFIEYFPKQSAPTKKYDGHSGASTSFVDQMCPLEALKSVLLLPYAVYSRKLKAVTLGVAHYLSGAIGSVGRTVGLNLAHSLLRSCSQNGYFEGFNLETIGSDTSIFTLLGAIESAVGSASYSVAVLAGQVLLEFYCWIAETPFSKAYAAYRESSTSEASTGKLINTVVSLLPQVNNTLRSGFLSSLKEYAKVSPQNVTATLPILRQFLELRNSHLRSQTFGLLIDFSEKSFSKSNDRSIELSARSLHVILELFEDSPNPFITKKICDLISGLDVTNYLYKGSFSDTFDTTHSTSEETSIKALNDAAEKALLPIVCLLWNRARLETTSTRIAVIDALYSLSINPGCPDTIQHECTRVLQILAKISAENDEYIRDYIMTHLHQQKNVKSAKFTGNSVMYLDVDSILAAEEDVLKGNFTSIELTSTQPTIKPDTMLECSKSQALRSISLATQKYAQPTKLKDFIQVGVYKLLRDCFTYVREADILNNSELDTIENDLADIEGTRSLSNYLFTSGIWHPIVNSSYDVRCDVSYVFINTALHKGVLILFSMMTSDKDLEADKIQLHLTMNGSKISAPAPAENVSNTNPVKRYLWFSFDTLPYKGFDELLTKTDNQEIFGGTLTYDINGMSDTVRLRPFGPSNFDLISTAASDSISTLRTMFSDSKEVLSGTFQLPDLSTKEDAADRIPSFLGLSLLETNEVGDEITLFLAGQVFLQSAAIVKCKIYLCDKKVHLQMDIVGSSKETIMNLMK